jgi:chemosensory pili system protein ChpE
MLTLFISAFLLGLIFNAAPGAVFAETVRQGVRGGFKPALAVQIGSLAGDASWAILGLVGIGMLLQLDWLRFPVGIAGVVYLVWLAYDSWREAGREFRIEPSAASQQRALRAGAILSITNPQNVAYWAAIGSAMGAVGVSEPTASDYATFFAGFMASSITWAFVCAAAIDILFRRAGLRWAAVTYKLCAVAFMALALGSVRDLVQQYRAQPRDSEATISEPQ